MKKRILLTRARLLNTSPVTGPSMRKGRTGQALDPVRRTLAKKTCQGQAIRVFQGLLGCWLLLGALTSITAWSPPVGACSPAPSIAIAPIVDSDHPLETASQRFVVTLSGSREITEVKALDELLFLTRAGETEHLPGEVRWVSPDPTMSTLRLVEFVPTTALPLGVYRLATLTGEETYFRLVKKNVHATLSEITESVTEKPSNAHNCCSTLPEPCGDSCGSCLSCWPLRYEYKPTLTPQVDISGNPVIVHVKAQWNNAGGKHHRQWPGTKHLVYPGQPVPGWMFPEGTETTMCLHVTLTDLDKKPLATRSVCRQPEEFPTAKVRDIDNRAAIAACAMPPVKEEDPNWEKWKKQSNALAPGCAVGPRPAGTLGFFGLLWIGYLVGYRRRRRLERSQRYVRRNGITITMLLAGFFSACVPIAKPADPCAVSSCASGAALDPEACRCVPDVVCQITSCLDGFVLDPQRCRCQPTAEPDVGDWNRCGDVEGATAGIDESVCSVETLTCIEGGAVTLSADAAADRQDPGSTTLRLRVENRSAHVLASFSPVCAPGVFGLEQRKGKEWVRDGGPMILLEPDVVCFWEGRMDWDACRSFDLGQVRMRIPAGTWRVVFRYTESCPEKFVRNCGPLLTAYSPAFEVH